VTRPHPKGCPVPLKRAFCTCCQVAEGAFVFLARPNNLPFDGTSVPQSRCYPDSNPTIGLSSRMAHASRPGLPALGAARLLDF
jgi:hypothetical protein